MEIEEVLPIEQKPSWLAVFRHRNFSLFFFGQLISLIGTWSQTLAMSWLVWKMTGSALWLGVVGFATQIPMLFLGLLGGAIADRFDRLKTLILMQVLCMLQAIVLAILTLTHVVELWHIIAMSALLGVVYSFEFPIRQAFIMDMVGKRMLLNAVSLNSAMFHASRLLGPVSAGLIVAWKGEGVCFAFNAATFLALIFLLLFVDRAKLIHSHPEKATMWRSITDGLKFARRNSQALTSIILVTMISVIGMPLFTLMPIFADKIFRGGAYELGWLMGAGAIGALFGAAWLSRRSTSEGLLHLSSRSGVSFSMALVAFSFASNFTLALFVLAFCGFFLTNVFSSANTLLQHVSPDHLRGRMMSLFTTAMMGLAPFGALLSGLAAKEIGAPLTVTISGAICAVFSVIIWLKAQKVEK